LNVAEIRALFVDNFERLMTVMEIVDETPSLGLIVHFDPLSSEQHAAVHKLNTNNNTTIVSFQELMVNNASHILSACSF
jgi:hypothetical protein